MRKSTTSSECLRTVAWERSWTKKHSQRRRCLWSCSLFVLLRLEVCFLGPAAPKLEPQSWGQRGWGGRSCKKWCHAILRRWRSDWDDLNSQCSVGEASVGEQSGCFKLIRTKFPLISALTCFPPAARFMILCRWLRRTLTPSFLQTWHQFSNYIIVFFFLPMFFSPGGNKEML